MKEIKTKYSKKMVDSKFYGTINIENNSNVVENNNDIVLVPYKFVEHTEESSKQYNEFMKAYNEQHRCCPNCGTSKSYVTTLMGYVLNWDKKDEYQDENRCRCENCGDVHKKHDRVPSKEISVNL